MLALAHAQPLDRRAVQHDAAGVGGALARDSLGELLLAVAVDPGDAEDFPFPYRKAHAGGAGRRRPAGRAEAVHRDHHPLARRPRPLRAAPLRGRPVGGCAEHEIDDMVDRLLRREPGEGLRRQGADLAALSQDRDPVAEAHRLVQLVGDEEDGDPGIAQPPDHPAEILDALRREHRGRLVEDQHALAPPQRLDDFDELLLAEGEGAERHVLRQVDAEPPGDLPQPGAGGRAVHGRPPRGAQHQVLENGERRHQGRMLVDGADAEIERDARAGDPGHAAANLDRARVGPLHARENRDQGRLAGAVLAEQCVDLRRVDVERDPVVGDDAGEALGDVPQHGDGPGRAGGALRRTGRHGQAMLPVAGRRRGSRRERARGRPASGKFPPPGVVRVPVQASQPPSTDDISARMSSAS